MSQSHRGQFGPVSLLVLLALPAGSVAAEPLPPLRINPALLGAGTPPPVAPAAVEAVVAAQPATSSPAKLEPAPTARVEPVPPQTKAAPAPGAQPAAKAARATPAPVAAPAAARTPVPAQRPRQVHVPPAAATEAPRRPDEPQVVPQQQAVPLVTPIQKPQEPPQVAERPALPPLYSALVAAGELPAPELRPAAGVMPHIKRAGETLPTFIVADHIAGRNDVEVVADGNVELRKRNSILLSDRLTYWQETDEMEAEGNVRLSRDGDRVRGPKMRMRMDESTGFFEQPEYSIRRIKTGSAATLWTGTEERVSAELTTGQGSAARMEFEGEGKYRLTDATYSTCTPAAGTDPDWFARTSDLRLDYDREEGTARDATLVFKGVPILYSPWLSFSLNNERKSGLLTPTFGSTSRGGVEYTQPFYWNIAQNMDATIAPRFMSKRGTLWNGEYRYLNPSFSGTMQGQYLPNDKVEHKHRSSYSVNHSHNLGYGVSGSLSLAGVSDDTFFSDLANGSSVVSQTNLLRQGTLSYGGGWWSANLLAQSYQTLQDPSLPPVTEPYRRLPQLTVNANRGDLPLGLNFAFSGEHVNFSNPTLVEGRRFTLYPQISLPLQTAVLSLTPKIGLHSTRYTLDRQAAGTPEKLTRDVPIFSVDSGVTFERGMDWFGRTLTQTLEPRLYYLYVPVRDQSLIPIFDTGIADFNFAQMFGENRYSGGDRIADANQATVMLTSRLLDPESGAEIIRAAFGQRFYFSTQNVGLPASATAPAEVLRSDRQTDFLGSISGRVLPKTYVDAGVQYNPRLAQVERFNLGGRYQPETGKVLNAGYRYTRGQLGVLGLGQFDISGQWPIFGGWHAVGRFNYSTKEGRMIESVAGLEYDGGCWVGRVVMQRLATQTQGSNTALFFQLELNGFAKVGSNPLDILKRNVPGYGLINQQGTEAPLTTP
ncbi:MAG: LPS-assembly protein [Rhodocyclaceae bacterium]|nr:MAG: LPS-assembly protein [Rhodocyclaceae bacterium]TND01206.1 MAG: LPS-assembly protein [Rhodocyclaceae bacterium]